MCLCVCVTVLWVCAIATNPLTEVTFFVVTLSKITMCVCVIDCVFVCVIVCFCVCVIVCLCVCDCVCVCVCDCVFVCV